MIILGKREKRHSCKTRNAWAAGAAAPVVVQLQPPEKYNKNFDVSSEGR